MKVKLQYLIEGQKVIMSTDRAIVGQLKTVAKDDITSITSDDLGVVKVEVFGAWRLTRSESNVDVGEIVIPEADPLVIIPHLSSTTTQEDFTKDQIHTLEAKLKELKESQKSPVKPRSNDSHDDTKTTSKSGKQPKSKQTKASSGVREVNL